MELCPEVELEQMVASEGSRQGSLGLRQLPQLILLAVGGYLVLLMMLK